MKACELACPDDAAGLKAAYDEGNSLEMGGEQHLLRGVSSMIGALPRGESQQRKVLLAAMCSTQTHTAARKWVGVLGKDLYATSTKNATFVLHGHELKTERE
jgi:hypothetical protein